MFSPDINFTRIVLFTNGLVPAALLTWDAYNQKLGANPIEFATRATGVLTLVFLFITLAVTPLRKLTGANWLVKFRRLVGLYAFFYGSLHLLTYVWFDKFFSGREIVEDVYARPFITIGMASFPCATLCLSTATRIRWRGFTRGWICASTFSAGSVHVFARY